MASPPPIPGPNNAPLIPDDIRWEIMTQSNSGTTTVGPNTRILRWNRGVVNPNVDDLEARNTDTGRNRLLIWYDFWQRFEEPIPLAPMTVEEVTPSQCECLIYCNDHDLNALKSRCRTSKLTQSMLGLLVGPVSNPRHHPSCPLYGRHRNSFLSDYYSRLFRWLVLW